MPLVVLLDTGEIIGALLISESLAGRRSSRSYTGSQIDLIYQSPRGVLLAVNLAAALLDAGGASRHRDGRR